MSALESLSAELFALIAEYIYADNCPLAAFAATSKQCQTHVETITFRSLRIQIDDWPSFLNIVNNSRFSALRELQYNFGFKKGEADDDILTTTLRSFLTGLHDKNRNHVDHVGLQLTIKASFERERKRVRRCCRGDVREPDYDVFTWLSLKEADIPIHLSIPAVKTLSWGTGFGRKWAKISAPSVSFLFARFPHLETIEDTIIEDGNRRAPKKRQEDRDKLETRLTQWKKLRFLHFDYCNTPPENEAAAPPQFTDPVLGYDIFSHELGILSQRLVELEVPQATFNLVDFFAVSGQWINLEEIYLPDLQIASADGTWYFNHDPNINITKHVEEVTESYSFSLERTWKHTKEEELPATMDMLPNRFRTATDPGKFREIYLAAADAAKRMPKLRTMCIHFEILAKPAWGRGHHGFQFNLNEEETGANKATWSITPAIDIDDKVIQAWKEVGAVKNLQLDLFQNGEALTESN